MKWGKKLISLVVAIILGLSLFLAPVVNQVSPAQAAVTWTKSSEEVTLKYPVTLDNELYVVDAWVIKEDSTYKMWYTHGRPDLSLSEIASDLIALNLGDIIDDIASLDLVALLTDIAGLDAGKLIDFLGNASTVIGYATSSDGLVWTVQNSLALEGSSGSAWDSVGNPCVIWDDTASEYKMWYTNSKTDLTEASLGDILTDLGDTDSAVVKAAILDLLDSISTVIGYATSPGGVTWTEQNPEVLAGSGSLLDSVGAPSVIWDETDGKYKMWYTCTKTDLAEADLNAILADIGGFDTSDLWNILDNVSTVIGYATSSNGISWDVQNDEVLFGSGNLLDSVADPSVIQNSPSNYEMWYTNSTSNLTVSDLPGLLLEIEALNLGALWDTLGDGVSAFLIAFVNLNITDIENLLSNTNTAIGYATSEDGEVWTLENPQHLVGYSGTPPWSSVAAPSVVKTGSKYEMWYTEGIEDITSLDDLTYLALGVDLPIGYAYYSPPAGGGGGFGLILTIDLTGVESSYLISLSGAILSTVERTTEDGELTIIIPGGTVILTKDGAAPIELIIAVDESPPPLPDGAVIIGTAYSFKPNGVTFDESMTFTFTYDPNNISGNVNEEDLVIAYYDLATGKWVELESVVDTEANTITAEVTHLTTFAVLGYEVVVPPVIPPVLPPTFTLSSLSISPDEVDIDEPVDISILVTNTGGSEGSYEVILKINDVVEATEEVTVSAGASKEVTFTVSKDVAGIYSVEVSGLTGSFTVKEEVVPPPTFTLSSLSISPDEVDIDEPVDISILVTNTGGSEGSYEVILKINDVVEATEEVTVSAGASKEVTFTVSKDAAGTYSVEVSGLTESFTVKEKVIPPVVPKPINWWLIGGIIAGVIAIGVVIWQVIRQRA